MLNISARHTCTVSAPAKRQRMVSRSTEGHEDAYEIARTARAGSAARLATVHNAAHDHNLMSRSGSEKRARRPMAVEINEVDVLLCVRDVEVSRTRQSPATSKSLGGSGASRDVDVEVGRSTTCHGGGTVFA
ncbi:MAG: hypothetical protein L6R35_000512 [Caloplaca aegaea]|nr:MAG: hypothetical protein L6R35_000512 [Caloplaca aegaea]